MGLGQSSSQLLVLALRGVEADLDVGDLGDELQLLGLQRGLVEDLPLQQVLGLPERLLLVVEHSLEVGDLVGLVLELVGEHRHLHVQLVLVILQRSANADVTTTDTEPETTLELELSTKVREVFTVDM